ncbi:MAG: adenylate/guanylate cyclase domain-containing protein [Rhodospirillales bacterium]|nr:adenylate/guanylate cyclase domain-containing protein [Rhodospirillales bacterium]MCB9996656.1 adenylate/guanylate cyclase domain-containing protein [Rhodospirillales bacterium]
MKKLLVNRWVHTLVLLGLLFGAVLVRTYDFDWSKSLRFLAFDAYNTLNPRPPTDAVVIVDIDEASLGHEELGQWPWSRDVMAKLVSNLTDMGASAIVFDMVFPERDRTSPQAILERLPADRKNDDLNALLEVMPDNDQVFAEAIRTSDKVVTAFIWSTHQEASSRKPVLSQPILMTKQASVLPQTVVPMVGAATNIPELSKAAAGNGCFGVSPEVDGIIRWVPLLFSYRGAGETKPIVYPSLAVEALRVSQGAKTLTKVRTLKPEEAGPFDPPLLMSIGKYEIPFDFDGTFYGYFSKERSQQYISAWRVINGELPPERIKDKIVFVGTSAEGLKDIRSTPLNLFIPGVEVHVNVVEQVLTGDFLLRPALLEGVELLTIIGVGLLIILLAPFIGAVFMAVFTMTLIATITLASIYSFEIHGLLLDPVYPSLCLLTLFIMSSLLTYMRTEAERKHVREAFGFYISPDLMSELASSPDKLKLGGETKDLTVMFSDIRNFTSISETMSPEALIHLMNEFLTPMSDLVMDHRGTIDKYMGDAMMAFWNAPLDDADHARHACMTALKMNKALTPINEELKRKAAEEGRDAVFLEAGIGINTGPASVGNMGSKQRFAYSALGDTVNLASRLEGQTKQYGVRILLGEQTRREAPEFAVLELDLIRVKGKREPERIFVLLGDAEMAQSEYFKDWEEKHNRMLEAYRAMKWDEARKLADQCQEISKEGMTMFYLMFTARIADMKKTPPRPDWNGVFVATSK